MIGRDELIEWLQSLPADAGISVDDGGLCLVTDSDPDDYIEVGGIPVEEDDDGGE